MAVELRRTALYSSSERSSSRCTLGAKDSPSNENPPLSFAPADEKDEAS